MKFFTIFERIMRRVFPSTFTIALFLTLLTFILALIFTGHVDLANSNKILYKNVISDPLSNSGNHFLQLVGFWYKGLWQTGLLAFAVQMMLILVLGYVLASTRVFQKLIDNVLVYCTSTGRAALLVTFFTLVVSFFNWGLGLIFGAIFARKVGEFAKQKNLKLNYPLIVAAGYSGLMVWHGGISGSAPLKVAEKGHFLSLVGKDIPPVDFSKTIFSEMNIVISIVLLIVLPVSLYLLGKYNTGTTGFKLNKQELKSNTDNYIAEGAEKLDYSGLISKSLGLGLITIAIYKAVLTGSLSVIDPNYLNFVLLGLGLLFCEQFFLLFFLVYLSVYGGVG